MPYANFSIRKHINAALFWGAAVWAALLLGGCSLITSPYPGPRSPGSPPSVARPAPSPQEAAPPAEPPAAVTAETPPAPKPKDTPRSQASLNVTEQGRRLLLGGQEDEAISVLERAIGINPNNGEAYYWLAEAWLKKGNKSQALEYHHQAWLRLRGQGAWDGRLREQRGRLEKTGR